MSNELIKRKKSILSDMASRTLSSSQCSSYTASPEVENMKTSLMIWMVDNMRNKIPMNNLMSREKAIRIFNKLKRQAASAAKMDTFSGNNRWYQNFKETSSEEFSSVVTKLIEENGYAPEQVFNINEAVLSWIKNCDRTSVTKNVQSVSSFNTNIDRVTLFLCCNAVGDYLMKPLLVNRAVLPQGMKETDLNGISIHWVENKKARINREIFCNWFHKCFVVEAEKYMKSKGLPFKILLILDKILCHPLNLRHPNVKVLVLSLQSNTNSLTQILDQSVIATFKISYVTRILCNIFHKLKNDESFTSTEDSKQNNILNYVENIASALNDVKHSNLNICHKAVCQEVVAPDITVATTKEGISNVIAVAKEFEKEDSDTLSKSDDGNFELIDPESESQLSDECNSDYKETDSFTAENLCKALELVKRLENAITDIDPNIQRASKFRQNLLQCCSEYQKIYEFLEKKLSKEICINNKDEVERNISSDTDDEFVLIDQRRLSDEQ